MAELIIYYKGEPILKESLSASLLIGSAKDVDIPLLDSVAPHHARIEMSREGILLVVGEGEVFCEGERVEGSRRLNYGERFDLGAYRFELVESSMQARQFVQKEKTLTSLGSGGTLKEKTIPPLQFTGPVRKTYRRARLVIGRGRGCDMVIENPYVSTKHAEIFIQNGVYRIRDLHSRNGTFVLGQPVTEAPLPEQGTLGLGQYQLSYTIGFSSQRPQKDESIFLLPPLRPGGEGRGLVGSSPAFLSLMRKLEKIAPTDDSVLLLGETGVGKDLLAQFLHHKHEKRHAHPFVVVNCATIPQTIADSQLFGHAKGAFTGAVADHQGFFEQADRGTLFLDEVGDLSPDNQARLLRVMEDGVVRRIGATADRHASVRMIFASNRDLTLPMSERPFREDLYHRFDWVLKVPPLRERREDIPALVHYFLEQHAPVPLQVGEPTLDYLQRREWRGNIRALNRAVRRAITNAVARGNKVLVESDFELEMEGPLFSATSSVSEVRQSKRQQLADAVRLYKGNVSKISRELGVSRLTIRRWLEADGIDLSSFRQ